MALFSVQNIQLTGIAACVPKNRENNIDLSIIKEKEKQLLIKTTGIRYRHIAPKHITTSDMCFKAATALLKEKKIDRKDIEILIFVTQSPDYYLPATSIILQDKLKLSKNCIAFDIQLGCSGYVYGLSVISSLMNNAKLKKGLLLVGDKSSFSPSKDDKSTYPIFGDAGTATILAYNTNAEKIDFNLQSDGAGHQAIIIPDGGMRNPFNEKSNEIKTYGTGIKRSRKNLFLDGIEVFNFSIREAPLNVSNLLHYNNTHINDYDYFLFHQANKLMNETIRKKLKLNANKVPYSLYNYGNTSSASIPLTIVTELKDVLTHGVKKVVFSAFGVGLSWGSASIELNNVTCLPIITIE